MCLGPNTVDTNRVGTTRGACLSSVFPKTALRPLSSRSFRGHLYYSCNVHLLASPPYSTPPPLCGPPPASTSITVSLRQGRTTRDFVSLTKPVGPHVKGDPTLNLFPDAHDPCHEDRVDEVQTAGVVVRGEMRGTDRSNTRFVARPVRDCRL